MKFFFLTVSLVFPVLLLAQPATVKTKDGIYTLTAYGDNILKLKYVPNGYRHGEKVSDAVIKSAVSNKIIPVQKPGDTSWLFTKWKISFKTDSGFSIGNLRLISAFQEPGFRGFDFALSNYEKIYGGGERALPLDRRGFRFNLYNNPWYQYEEGADNLNYSVPFFTSNKGYAILFDNASKGFADIGKSNPQILRAGFVSGELNVFIILGDTYPHILQSYHSLTGTQPIPPRWAFGNLMSRFGYTSQQQVTAIAAQMKASHIPFDAVIFDLFWFGDSIKGTMGNLDWVNKKNWPNPAHMIADFKKDHIQTILITEPHIVKGTLNYEASKKYQAVDSSGYPFVIQSFYFGPAGLLDLFRKDAQNWFWSKHIPQMKIGVAGWWGDLGEPENHPPALQHNLKDLGFHRLFGADEVHNVFGHTWTKMLYQKFAKDFPDRRLFSLNRSGFAGTQRYGIFPWSGDVSRSWSGLRAQLPVMLGMSMSGVPYIHADAGGFAGGKADPELYVRWMQFAAFTPILRPHGTALFTIDPNAFSYPSEPALFDEPYRSQARKAIDMRYLLLPYNYTLAYWQAAKGEPLVSPLYYYYQNDSTASEILNEYIWGKNILIAPVLQPGADSVTLYLPAGNWFDFNTAKKYEGSHHYTIPAKIDDPGKNIFMKAGSLVPVWQPKENFIYTNTSAFDGRDINLLYYPGHGQSHAVCYLDDGHSKNPKSGLLEFSGTGTEDQIDIKIKSVGVYQKNASRNIRLQLPTLDIHKKIRVWVNGKKFTHISKMYFNHQTAYSFYSLPLTYQGKPLHVIIKMKN